AGLIEPCVDLGQAVQVGQILARVHDIQRTGAPAVEYRARLDGLLVGRHFPGLVQAGGCPGGAARPGGRPGRGGQAGAPGYSARGQTTGNSSWSIGSPGWIRPSSSGNGGEVVPGRLAYTTSSPSHRVERARRRRSSERLPGAPWRVRAWKTIQSPG